MQNFRKLKTTLLGIKFIFFVKFRLIPLTFFLSSGICFGKSIPLVNFIDGKAYLQPKKNISNTTTVLKKGLQIKETLPFALVTSKNSYVEVLNYPESKNSFRLGKSSAVELRSPYHLYYFQGSTLISHRNYVKWRLESKSTVIEIYSEGTWLVETTEQHGFKIILLEGDLQFLTNQEKVKLRPGELILVSEQKNQISQRLKIDLPLLLSTSRLINNFDTKLPSQSRLISAAQVQSIRLKKKYEAVIGGVKKNKLQIWALKKD